VVGHWTSHTVAPGVGKKVQCDISASYNCNALRPNLAITDSKKRRPHYPPQELRKCHRSSRPALTVHRGICLIHKSRETKNLAPTTLTTIDLPTQSKDSRIANRKGVNNNFYNTCLTAISTGLPRKAGKNAAQRKLLRRVARNLPRNTQYWARRKC